MRRQLLYATAFARAARRLVQKQPRAAQDVEAALAQLAEDAFHPSLRTSASR
jgi:hypothetical protein